MWSYFLAILLGCLENCLPFLVSFRFLRVVAAYSEELKDFIALSGKYLSPVSADFLPDFVLHFCLVHFF